MSFLTSSGWLICLTTLLGACPQDDPKTFPLRPEGVGDPCTSDIDCQEGQVCVMSSAVSSYVNTCQIPCPKAPDRCVDYSGYCSVCDDAIVPPICLHPSCS